MSNSCTKSTLRLIPLCIRQYPSQDSRNTSSHHTTEVHMTVFVKYCEINAINENLNYSVREEG